MVFLPRVEIFFLGGSLVPSAKPILFLEKARCCFSWRPLVADSRLQNALEAEKDDDSPAQQWQVTRVFLRESCSPFRGSLCRLIGGEGQCSASRLFICLHGPLGAYPPNYHGGRRWLKG